MPTYIGIDPGLDGAIALWTPGLAGGGGAPPLPPSLAVYDMPVIMGEVSGKPRRMIDRAGLRTLVTGLFDLYSVDKIVAEKVGQMPGQSGMFSFGFGYGCLVMLVEMMGKSVIQVAPGTWKKDMKAPKDKARAMARAQDLFPQHAHLFYRPHETQAGKVVPRPDRAEAAMMALWAEKHA